MLRGIVVLSLAGLLCATRPALTPRAQTTNKVSVELSGGSGDPLSVFDPSVVEVQGCVRRVASSADGERLADLIVSTLNAEFVGRVSEPAGSGNKHYVWVWDEMEGWKVVCLENRLFQVSLDATVDVHVEYAVQLSE